MASIKTEPQSHDGPELFAHPRGIVEIEARIAKATRDSNTWRAAGFNERYLEAYSLGEALEVELAVLAVSAPDGCGKRR